MTADRPAEIVEASFLRHVDARAKLVLALGASSAAMLPLWALAVFCAGFTAFVAFAGLARRVLAQLIRALPVLLVLFLLDAAVVGVSHAALITLRLCVVATTFVLVSATTTAEELAAALERWGVSPRLAFVFAAAHRALASIGDETRTIVEAQRARGLGDGPSDRRASPVERLRRGVSYAVPAVVLVTERAWRLNEAAQARGLESPHRTATAASPLSGRDRVLILAAIVTPVALAWWS